MRQIFLSCSLFMYIHVCITSRIQLTCWVGITIIFPRSVCALMINTRFTRFRTARSAIARLACVVDHVHTRKVRVRYFVVSWPEGEMEGTGVCQAVEVELGSVLVSGETQDQGNCGRLRMCSRRNSPVLKQLLKLLNHRYFNLAVT